MCQGVLRILLVVTAVTVLVTAGLSGLALADDGLEENGEYDSVTFEITVYENGSATWTFSYERLLATDEEIETFEAFAGSFEEDPGIFYDRRVAQAEALVETAERATDRDMAVGSVDHAAYVETQINEVGVVEVSFLWEGFARTEGDTVIVDDVLTDVWLDSNQYLTIQAGDQLTIETAEPDGDIDAESRSITWSGQEYTQITPYVELTGGEGDSIATLYLVAGVLLFAAIAGITVAWYRSRRDRSGMATGQTAQDTTDPVTPTADELLSDEDRVVKLIRENGGRMKQVRIVEETGWSKSKVSMLLSEMEEDETISKLRVGRENIISLQGFEPEAAKSPHEN